MSNADFSSQRPQDSEPTQVVATSAASTLLAAGTLLGNNYIIEERLARGGMGEVFRARHVELGTEYAIKIILPSLADDPRIVELFREEARKLERLNHDAIVNYKGFFRDERGLRYLVTEFVHGESLEQVLRRRRLEPEEVLRLRNRLALGLAAAHEMGIVHRDVSPENILLPAGSIERAKVIDFGIAKSTDPSSVTFIGGDFAGKFSYVSPEQVGMFGGRVDLRSDIYSLGLVLAAAAIGFGGRLDMGNTVPTMIAARQRVPDLSEVPASLRPVIAPMLEPRPEDRPPSMRALLESPKLATAPERRWPKARLAIMIGALLLLAVPAGLGLYFWTSPPSVEELSAHLAAATAGYQCAALNYSVSPDRTAVLSGHVANETDLQRLRQEVDGIRGFAGTPGFGVWLMIWPYCEADALLTPVMAQPSQDAPRITLASKTDQAHIGDCLMLDVVAPGFDSYVYVDYFAAEGSVLHLLPNRWDIFNLKPPRNHFTLGRPAQAPDCWRLGGATGEQLITLIAAKKPLFPDGRPDTENARDYLASLSDVIKATPQGDSAASLLFFNLRQ
jgi:Protein kinase domain